MSHQAPNYTMYNVLKYRKTRRNNNNVSISGTGNCANLMMCSTVFELVGCICLLLSILGTTLVLKFDFKDSLYLQTVKCEHRWNRCQSKKIVPLWNLTWFCWVNFTPSEQMGGRGGGLDNRNTSCQSMALKTVDDSPEIQIIWLSDKVNSEIVNGNNEILLFF